MYDFQALAPAETDHRDADLLVSLERLAELRAQLMAAKQRGHTAYEKVIRLVCREITTLEGLVAATPALTPGGRHAKALHAIWDADLDLPSGGFKGFGAVARSALFDILQAGDL